MRNLSSDTVEPVLGALVNFTAMKKVYTQSIASADKCMIMAATAYNLKKSLKKSLKQVNRPHHLKALVGYYTSQELSI